MVIILTNKNNNIPKYDQKNPNIYFNFILISFFVFEGQLY